MSRRIEWIIRGRESYRAALTKEIVVQCLQAAQSGPQSPIRVDLLEQHFALLHLQQEPARQRGVSLE
jgi:hypothetical protein